jgi:hypothetical protein
MVRRPQPQATAALISVAMAGIWESRVMTITRSTVMAATRTVPLSPAGNALVEASLPATIASKIRVPRLRPLLWWPEVRL